MCANAKSLFLLRDPLLLFRFISLLLIFKDLHGLLLELLVVGRNFVILEHRLDLADLAVGALLEHSVADLHAGLAVHAALLSDFLVEYSRVVLFGQLGVLLHRSLRKLSDVSTFERHVCCDVLLDPIYDALLDFHGLSERIRRFWRASSCL